MEGGPERPELDQRHHRPRPLLPRPKRQGDARSGRCLRQKNARRSPGCEGGARSMTVLRRRGCLLWLVFAIYPEVALAAGSESKRGKHIQGADLALAAIPPSVATSC